LNEEKLEGEDRDVLLIHELLYHCRAGIVRVWRIEYF